MSVHTFLLALLITLALTAYIGIAALQSAQARLHAQHQHVVDTFAILSK